MQDEVDAPDPEVEVESWVRIQQHTFTNWVNDKLQIYSMEIDNLRTDFRDGIKLCRLIEVLRGKKIGRVTVKKKLNYYEARGNMQLAFDALTQDRVRLVNIGQ